MTWGVGVVVPARDEADHIAACLAALRAAIEHVGLPADRLHVGARGRLLHRRHGNAGRPPPRGLGRGAGGGGREPRCGAGSRHRGAAARLAAIRPARLWLASTDADTVVPVDWLSRHLACARAGAMAVAGVVEVDSLVPLPPGVAEEYDRIYRGPPDEEHPHVHAANLGVQSRRLPCRRRLADRGAGRGAPPVAGRARTWLAHDVASFPAGHHEQPPRQPASGRLRRLARRAGCGRGSAMTAAALRTTLRELLEAGELDLPFPGGGDTASRFEGLMALTRHDVALGRLVEAHADAVAILAEAGRPAEPGILYGVWAADFDGSRVVAERQGSGWRLDGTPRLVLGRRSARRGARHHHRRRSHPALRGPCGPPGTRTRPDLVARAGTRRHHHMDDDLRRRRGARRLPRRPPRLLHRAPGLLARLGRRGRGVGRRRAGRGRRGPRTTLRRHPSSRPCRRGARRDLDVARRRWRRPPVRSTTTPTTAPAPGWSGR